MADLRQNLEESEQARLLEDEGELPLNDNDSNTNIDHVGLSEGHHTELLSRQQSGKDNDKNTAAKEASEEDEESEEESSVESHT